MHNCKSSRSRFPELAGDELTPAESMQLLAEVNDCAACREEYQAVKSIMHVSGQALRSGLPAETFWFGYRERLRSRLVSSQAQSHASSYSVSRSSRIWAALRRVATGSVRVPIPAALAVMLLIATSFVVLRPRGQANAAASIPVVSVKTTTVQVPVIQEKLVTRIVYVDKNHGRRAVAPDRKFASAAASSVARALPHGPGQAPLSLVDFKPTDQVKLTITRSNYKDEK